MRLDGYWAWINSITAVSKFAGTSKHHCSAQRLVAIQIATTLRLVAMVSLSIITSVVSVRRWSIIAMIRLESASEIKIAGRTVAGMRIIGVLFAVVVLSASEDFFCHLCQPMIEITKK